MFKNLRSVNKVTHKGLDDQKSMKYNNKKIYLGILY